MGALNVILVARNVYPINFFEDQLALKIFGALRTHFKQLFLIVQSPDGQSHYWQEGNLVVYYVGKYHNYLVNTAYFVFRGSRIAMIINGNCGVDVVNGSDLLGGLVSLIMKYLFGTKFVMQFQYQFFNMPRIVPLWRRILYKKVARFLGKRADVIRCVTQEIRQTALIEGIPERNVRVVPARCDVEMFKPSAEIRRHARFSLDVQDKKVVIYVGSLLPLKGVHILIEAIKRLSLRVSDLVLVVVGDGSERKELERTVKACRLEDKIMFLGRLRYSEVPRILSAADVFIFPSFSEAMPRAVLEAMAMELPVIASGVGGIVEIIEDGWSGYLISPGDVSAIISTTSFLLSDEGLRRKIGKRARETVVEGFDFDKNVLDFASLHYNLV